MLPLYMYIPWGQQTLFGTWGWSWVSFLLVLEKRGLEWPAIPFLPQALDKYSGQAVANSLSSPWRVYDYCGVGECPSTLREEKKKKKKKTCPSAKMGDKGSSGFCTGTCPKAFLSSFNLLWHATLFYRGHKEDCVATNGIEKCCSWQC